MAGCPRHNRAASAWDGPPLLNDTEPTTVLAATALAGTVTAVVTSARGEIVVVALAVSGSTLAPWLVVVTVLVPNAVAVLVAS